MFFKISIALQPRLLQIIFITILSLSNSVGISNKRVSAHIIILYQHNDTYSGRYLSIYISGESGDKIASVPPKTWSESKKQNYLTK